MRYLSLFVALSGFSTSVVPLSAAALPACTESARVFYPCEFSFDFNSTVSAYRNEILTVEFRSPSATTYRLRAFPSGKAVLKVRFSPTENGTWTYRISSSLKQFDGKESTFNAAASDSPGFVSAANLRHWRTTNKQPHLWLSAEFPFVGQTPTAVEAWLDARKHDGFTHVRGSLLAGGVSAKPLDGEGQPNFSYFDSLDQTILAAAQKGFVLDLILADADAVRSGILDDASSREFLVRYLVARYGGLNLTWNGVEKFDSRAGSRELLKDVGALLAKYDPYRHPRTTDAQVSSSPLLPDGWMTFLVESSPHPEVGAVEHQFTSMPEIHVVTATQPDEFRRELWNCTTNGEYPSISYASLRDNANLKAIQVWARILADTRHWELEPFFDVSGGRAVGLEEVEYLAYAQTGGIVELSLPKHKYNPLWINPVTGEEIPLKDYKGETFSRQTPDSAHDWILQVPREGHKESMLRSYRFESVDPPVQEIETDTARIPFQIVDPKGDELSLRPPPPYGTKLLRNNRSTRSMQYLWWGEVVAGGEGMRLLGIGASGTLQIPQELQTRSDAPLNLRVQALNANGKAFEIDRVYRLTQ
jgi:hypothetical protein